MKKNNKQAENKPCAIHGVMPSYLQEVEKEAFIMIQKYGKKRAEEEAILIAESYIEDINNLECYNAEKIDLWDKRKFFWLEVAKCIRNCPQRRYGVNGFRYG